MFDSLEPNTIAANRYTPSSTRYIESFGPYNGVTAAYLAQQVYLLVYFSRADRYRIVFVKIKN